MTVDQCELRRGGKVKINGRHISTVDIPDGLSVTTSTTAQEFPRAKCACRHPHIFVPLDTNVSRASLCAWQVSWQPTAMSLCGQSG